MTNSYEILNDSRLNESVRIHGIHESLNFKGLVVMDSGGFQFMKHQTICVSPRTILDLYGAGKPNYGVILDHPIGPNISTYHRRKRQRVTLENTKEMVRTHQDSNPLLIPVVHAQSAKSASWYVRELLKIDDFPIIGIGSLVPSMFNTYGALATHTAIHLVSYIRRTLPRKIIHAFGIASTLSMHLMYSMGIDSVDSSAWRLKAAFGAIQLPGIGDRYISKRERWKHYRDISVEERQLLDDCHCPICRKDGLDSLRESFSARAIHNAWVYQSEAMLARKLIRTGEYEDYVDNILSRSVRFSRLFALTKKHKSKTV